MVVLEYHIFNIQQIGGSNVYTSANGGTHTGDWNYNLQFRAVDAVGNAGAWTGTYNVKIDKTPPMATKDFEIHDSDQWMDAPYVSWLYYEDNVSGVAHIQYSTSLNGPWYECGVSGPAASAYGER